MARYPRVRENQISVPRYYTGTKWLSVFLCRVSFSAWFEGKLKGKPRLEIILRFKIRKIRKRRQGLEISNMEALTKHMGVRFCKGVYRLPFWGVKSQKQTHTPYVSVQVAFCVLLVFPATPTNIQYMKACTLAPHISGFTTAAGEVQGCGKGVPAPDSDQQQSLSNEQIINLLTSSKMAALPKKSTSGSMTFSALEWNRPRLLARGFPPTHRPSSSLSSEPRSVAPRPWHLHSRRAPARRARGEEKMRSPVAPVAELPRVSEAFLAVSSRNPVQCGGVAKCTAAKYQCPEKQISLVRVRYCGGVP